MRAHGGSAQIVTLGYTSEEEAGVVVALGDDWIEVDLPADLSGLGAMLHGFDERLVGAGGRLYLAKDSRARAETVHAMYPELPAWRRVRGRADPGGVLVSDMARRLRLLRHRARAGTR